MNDILVDDHAEVGALLGGLWDAFDGGDAREVLAKLDYVWARLAMHIRAEHLHLFPALSQAAGAGPASPDAPTPQEVYASIERLREDHDLFMRELAGAVNETRSLAAEGVSAGGARLRQVRERVLAVAERLAEHNRLEEEQAYLWQGSLLDGAARAGLSAAMRREVENVPPRFSN